jgi:cell division protein FtsQ
VFDDPDPLTARAESLEGVVSARVERKLPATLRVLVVERVPVAFVAGGARLVAVDGDARALPYDGASTPLDLPIVSEGDSLAVRALSVVRSTDSTLFREIDSARRGSRGEIRLEVASGQVILPPVPAPEDVRAVAAVRRHLEAAGRAYRELDTRYRGWVVVRRSLS